MNQCYYAPGIAKCTKPNGKPFLKASTSRIFLRTSLRLLRTSLRIPNLFVLLDDDGGRLRDSCVALLALQKQAAKMITAPGVARTKICLRHGPAPTAGMCQCEMCS